MSLRKTTTDVAGQVNGVKVLVYSEAGNGKTFLCSTAPDPLVLSAESGLMTLRKYKIPAWELDTVEDLNQAYLDICRSQYKTICLDSVSEIAERILANAKRQVKDPRQAYGELIEKMVMVVRAFRDLPGRNVYFAAKAEPMKDEMTGAVKWGPSMPGSKLGPALPYFFDEVFYLGRAKDQQGKEYRYLLTRPNYQYYAKDRSGVLAEYEPPDLNYLFSKIVAS